MKNMGNTKSNQLYNPDERRNPPPANLEHNDRGSELEKYIRVRLPLPHKSLAKCLSCPKSGEIREKTIHVLPLDDQSTRVECCLQYTKRT